MVSRLGVGGSVACHSWRRIPQAAESVSAVMSSVSAVTVTRASGSVVLVEWSDRSMRARLPTRMTLPDTTRRAPSRRASATASANRGESSVARAFARTVRASAVRMPPTPSRLALSVTTISRPSRVSAVSGTAGTSGKTAIVAAGAATGGRRSRARSAIPAMAIAVTVTAPNAMRRRLATADRTSRGGATADTCTPPSASPNSPALGNRSAGSFAIAFATAPAT